MSLPVIYTPEELADALKLTSDWWIREQIRKGRCEATKVAGHWRFTERQAAELIRLATVQPAPKAPATVPARRRRGPEPETPETTEPAAEEPTLQARIPRRRRTNAA
jgi:hypothetical protein